MQFLNVPKQAYQDSGLPPEKLQCREYGPEKYLDDDEYEQYVAENSLSHFD